MPNSNDDMFIKKDVSLLIRFLSFFDDLSDKELRKFATLLSQPMVTRALISLIESSLTIRKAERTSGSQKISTPPIRDSSVITSKSSKNEVVQNGISSRMSVDEARRAFSTLLEDRDLFPSTRDIVDAINLHYDWQISYEKFKKRGRRDLIQICLSRLKTYSDIQQVKKTYLFIERLKTQHSGVDHYKNLFNILVGNE